MNIFIHILCILLSYLHADIVENGDFETGKKKPTKIVHINNKQQSYKNKNYHVD